MPNPKEKINRWKEGNAPNDCFHPRHMMIGDIVIERQPVSVCVPANFKVTLSVRAEGAGILKYQWFTNGDDGENYEVHGGTQADLIINPVKTHLYVCRVNDNFYNWVFSEWVKVKVLDIDASVSGLPRHWQGNPHIAINPKPQTVQPGAKITLRCSAFGNPAPRYQWHRNGLALLKNTTDTLQIDHAEAKHEGTYLCSVSNVLEEIWSEPVQVDIVQNDRLPQSPTKAVDKVALLIGNLNYSNHPALMAPMMDVHELANLLRQLGFRVVSLLDLTKVEMLAAVEKFFDLLHKGVYGLFYYAGHGYESAGRNYLVPVDAPRPYRTGNCVCVQRIMLQMQERHTALNVILLDTCRKWYNQQRIASEIMPQQPKGNTVYGYGTCEDAEAFEVQDGGRSTGIFTKYLNKHILQAEKVTHVLERASEDLGRDPLITGKQAVEIKHTLNEPRSLADPVQTAGHTRELHLRDFCWRQANELPRKRRLVFHCGVKVEVSFSALFSNVIVAFGVIKTTGPKTDNCTITLSSIPAMEELYSGPGRFEEADSMLFDNAVNPDCTLRVCGLQKLKESLVIKMDLHYTHTESRQRLTESQRVDIGKPLVASCKLYETFHTSRKKQDIASAQSMGNILHSKQEPNPNQPGPGQPFTRKAECGAPFRCNEPEENDETELQDVIV
ncbi:mucosa-associated lymphoid tissue lymphoma translocation protein 1 [Syngnathus typhle]|uniref:mucosa-associated lymphoid tissue lymphoma translocation protein 1 n=1 Tax=Syngnathus typhle TaxID=161592 RepID=UPI002A6ACB9A|nr:mucosa-associated lymphoid tissue lymphoma translocation protein 1 [Syngnathus typhle]XP_061138382.1 mucosa-associated lymphoid tissue lymphoma translocation protein 1 [Syngnathus typhle]